MLGAALLTCLGKLLEVEVDWNTEFVRQRTLSISARGRLVAKHDVTSGHDGQRILDEWLIAEDLRVLLRRIVLAHEDVWDDWEVTLPEQRPTHIEGLRDVMGDFLGRRC